MKIQKNIVNRRSLLSKRNKTIRAFLKIIILNLHREFLLESRNPITKFLIIKQKSKHLFLSQVAYFEKNKNSRMKTFYRSTTMQIKSDENNTWM